MSPMRTSRNLLLTLIKSVKFHDTPRINMHCNITQKITGIGLLARLIPNMRVTCLVLSKVHLYSWYSVCVAWISIHLFILIHYTHDVVNYTLLLVSSNQENVFSYICTIRTFYVSFGHRWRPFSGRQISCGFSFFKYMYR